MMEQGLLHQRQGGSPNLADVLERVLDKGLIIAGDIKINLLDIELLTIKLRLLVASVDKAKAMGIDWWEHDPALSHPRPRQAHGRERALAQAGQGAGNRYPGGTAMSAASYTYAVARPFDPARAADLVGIDGTAIHLVRHQELVAVVSPLAPAAADETALRARLETLAELEAIARAHHGVVAAVAACTPTLPLRLATVHRGDERVAQVLRQEYRRFSETLDRLAGRVEVGVKIYVGHAEETSGAGPDRDAGAGTICATAASSATAASTRGNAQPLRPSRWTPFSPGLRSSAASTERRAPSCPLPQAKMCSTQPTWWMPGAPKSSPRMRGGWVPKTRR